MTNQDRYLNSQLATHLLPLNDRQINRAGTWSALAQGIHFQ